MTSPSPLERLAGPGNVLAKEPPDAKEFAGLVRSGMARLTQPTGTRTRQTCHLTRPTGSGTAVAQSADAPDLSPDAVDSVMYSRRPDI